jgi:hypothetical protein
MDIRVWASANGIDVAPKGPIPKAVKAQYYDRLTNGQLHPEAETPPGSEPPEPEAPPAEGKKSWFSRRSRDASSRPSRRRTSVEQIVGLAWEFGAFALAQDPRMLPVARCVNMQAPVAGIIIDDAVKGTVADKILQPIARAGEQGEKFFGLIGPPLLVGAITAKPELYPALRPALKMSLIQWMYISEPAAKKAEKRAKDWQERFGGVDVDGMIDALFAPAEPFNPQEEEAIRRARDLTPE